MHFATLNAVWCAENSKIVRQWIRLMLRFRSTFSVFQNKNYFSNIVFFKFLKSNRLFFTRFPTATLFLPFWLKFYCNFPFKLPVTLAWISDHYNPIQVPVHVNLVHFPPLTIFVVRYASLVPDTVNRNKEKRLNSMQKCNKFFGFCYKLLIKCTGKYTKITINDLHRRIGKKAACFSKNDSNRK